MSSVGAGLGLAWGAGTRVEWWAASYFPASLERLKHLTTFLAVPMETG